MKDYTFEGFNGFAKHQPVLAAAALIFLLSLAGIPLTAGFISKFYMLKAVLQTGGFLWVVIIAVLMAAVSVYYYFRVIQAIYFKEPSAAVVINATDITPAFKILLVLTAVLIIVLGIYPELIIGWMYH